MTDKSVFFTPRLPARLNVEQVAERLGFQVYEVGVLMKHGLLRPLGNPSPNSHKWFAGIEIERLASDQSWLDKATKVVAKHFKAKATRSSCSNKPHNIEMTG